VLNPRKLNPFISVFEPAGEDGYPRALYDKWTGEIDKGVVDYWKENYALRHILQRDWEPTGSKLEGKIHIYMGDIDTYFLEESNLLLEEFLESTSEPHYAGWFNWGRREPHCYTGTPEYPGQTAYERVLPRMMERIVSTAPPGADTTSWRYWAKAILFN
jgi:hypothetical protein